MELSELRQTHPEPDLSLHIVAWYQGMFRLAALNGNFGYSGPVDGVMNDGLIEAIKALQLSGGLALDPDQPRQIRQQPSQRWEPLGYCPGIGSRSYDALQASIMPEHKGLWALPECRRPFLKTSLNDDPTQGFEGLKWLDIGGAIVTDAADLRDMIARYPGDAVVVIRTFPHHAELVLVAQRTPQPTPLTPKQKEIDGEIAQLQSNPNTAVIIEDIRFVIRKYEGTTTDATKAMWGINPATLIEARSKGIVGPKVGTTPDLRFPDSIRIAYALYLKPYVIDHGFESVPDLAVSLFDIFFNSRPASAARVIQKAINNVVIDLSGHPQKDRLKVDGKYGSATIRAIREIVDMGYGEGLALEIDEARDQIIFATSSVASGLRNRLHGIRTRRADRRSDKRRVSKGG